MSGSRLLRVAPSAAVKERRLAGLIAQQPERQAFLTEQVLDAQLLGSLDLARLSFSWEEIKASRDDGRPALEPARALRRAQAAAQRTPSLSVDALVAWHAEMTGSPSALRTGPRERVGGPPTSPPEFVRSRLEGLAEWLSADSGRELQAPQRGALGLARFVEISPFDDANGRVSRLLASHLMVQAGARPPILAGGDRERLDQCLGAAFQLMMEPLAMLLEEASERALDVQLQTLEGR